MNLDGPDLDCLNQHSMLKISYAGYLSLSPAISAQFTFKMRVPAQNREKFIKTPYFGGSRSFKVIDVDISNKLLPVLVMIRSMSMPICKHFHVRRANRRNVFRPWFVGTPFTQWHKILSANTRPRH